MFRNKIIDPAGIILATACFLFSLFLFYSDTATFWGSAAAALLAAGMFWIMYTIVRVVILAFRE
ncbi:MAG: hypothetical protein WCF65_06135 [Parachlamydiaceae bacterium]